MASVKLVLDSVNPFGNRLTTFEVELPKFLLAQLNTHRQLSRNAASSRAIPLKRFRELATYTPDVWWANDKGMQPIAPMREGYTSAEFAWHAARTAALEEHEHMEQYGVHKQQANRILEPFAMVKVLVSATEWDNFLNLRLSAGAQDEIQDVAQQIGRFLLDNDPTYRPWLGEAYVAGISTSHDWHIPYLQPADEFGSAVHPSQYPKMCAGRCARVSYLNHDGTRDPFKDLELAERLIKDGHLSPFEHVAVAVPGSHANYKGWCSYRRFLLDETKVNDSWKGLVR